MFKVAISPIIPFAILATLWVVSLYAPFQVTYVFAHQRWRASLDVILGKSALDVCRMEYPSTPPMDSSVRKLGWEFRWRPDIKHGDPPFLISLDGYSASRGYGISRREVSFNIITLIILTVIWAWVRRELAKLGPTGRGFPIHEGGVEEAREQPRREDEQIPEDVTLYWNIQRKKRNPGPNKEDADCL